MFVIIGKKKYEALLDRISSLELMWQTPNEFTVALTNGNTALEEAREIREHIWPLFSQGAAANAKLIEKVGKLPD